MPPTWLTVLAWLSLFLAFLTAGVMLYDIYGRGYRQKMRVMEVVWPVAALYLGPLAWVGYRRWGRLSSPRCQSQAEVEPDSGEAASVGGGCQPLRRRMYGGGHSRRVARIRRRLAAGRAGAAGRVHRGFALAFALGIVFQYFSIAPMRGLGLRDGVIAAVKADALSLISFEVGLFGWMALMQLVFFGSPWMIVGEITPARVAV